MSALRPLNHKIDSWHSLDSDQFIGSLEKGELKGKLKEEDANPVIMLVKHKK